jgi:hypothetical protein
VSQLDRTRPQTPEPRASRRTPPWVRSAVALALCMIVGGAVAPHAQQRPGGLQGPGKTAPKQGARVDAELSDRLSRGGDSDLSSSR